MEVFVFILIIVCFSFFFNVVREKDDPIWHVDPLGEERRLKGQTYQDTEELQGQRLEKNRQQQIWIEVDIVNNFLQ